jgi:hypothetical protein
VFDSPGLVGFFNRLKKISIKCYPRHAVFVYVSPKILVHGANPSFHFHMVAHEPILIRQEKIILTKIFPLEVKEAFGLWQPGMVHCYSVPATGRPLASITSPTASA